MRRFFAPLCLRPLGLSGAKKPPCGIRLSLRRLLFVSDSFSLWWDRAGLLPLFSGRFCESPRPPSCYLCSSSACRRCGFICLASSVAMGAAKKKKAVPSSLSVGSGRSAEAASGFFFFAVFGLLF